MILAFIGGSGAGKSMLEKEFVELGYKKIVSYTSREPRIGEVNFRDYIFTGIERFSIHRDFFAEIEEYSGKRFYGTAIDDYMLDDKDKVVVLTPNGLRQIKSKFDFLDIFSVYVTAPLKTRVLRYINRCEDFNQAEMNEINSRAERDWGMFRGIENEVDLVINNDGSLSVAEMVAKILTAIESR